MKNFSPAHCGGVGVITSYSIHYTKLYELWKWCAANDVRFIYASSAATYGDGTQGFSDAFSEAALAHLKPMNPYGWSKHLFDRRVAAKIAAGMPTPPQWAGLKFFNVYGPNEYRITSYNVCYTKLLRICVCRVISRPCAARATC